MAIVRADSLRTLGFASISASYAAVGTATTHPWHVFKITNNTDGDMIISFDTVTDNLFVPAGSFVLYDLAANGPPISDKDIFLLQIGTQFYVKQSTAPSKGAIWVEGLYARGT